MCFSGLVSFLCPFICPVSAGLPVPIQGCNIKTSGWPGAIPGHPEETVLKVKHPSVRIENPLLTLVKGYGVF